MDTKPATTTLRLPLQLYREAKSVAQQNGMSFNDLVIESLALYLRAITRAEIDASFAGMATDSAYISEAYRIMCDFARSDFEALEIVNQLRRTGERDGH